MAMEQESTVPPAPPAPPPPRGGVTPMLPSEP